MRTESFYPKHRWAFTLIELLVVVAIVALLMSILLPSLSQAREHTKSVKCISNLRTLGQGIMLFAAEEKGKLPGGLHPAVYREQDPASYPPSRAHMYKRQLTYKLKRVFQDTGGGRDTSMTDEVATCPTLARINPDANFDAYGVATGNPAFPTHYALNNYGTDLVDAETPVPVTPGTGVRITNPPYYFGRSSPDDTPAERAKDELNPPKGLDKIARPSEEWAIADAWYRKATFTAAQELQQEGPYQVGWTGEALPYFAPHFAKGLSSYMYSSSRSTQASAASRDKKDGRTNTVFFDGHASPQRSRTYKVPGYGPVLYGFRGTVNPAKKNPPPPPDPAQQSIWDGVWE